MIYLDNSATTLHQPPGVRGAMVKALEEVGNPGRSFHSPALTATRMVLSARQSVGKLVGCSPLSVALTSGATESLNLVISGLISREDHVITTVLEHNSVLRPLYLAGCELSILPCDDFGELDLEKLPALLQKNTRFLVATHGSNLLGNVTPVAELKQFCKDHGITLILDISQTFGSIPVEAELADVLCFTGHKGLMGPQGTGGVIAASPPRFSLVKTGGAGSHSFAPHQSLDFPDVLEAGTPNTHGLAGLRAGADFVAEIGVEAIEIQENALCKVLLEGLAQIAGVKIYGRPDCPLGGRLPVVALNLEGYSSEEVACALWDGWEIATRPGAHCAPLVHQHFATETQGMVRLSLGYYTTHQEIHRVLTAIDQLARQGVGG